MKNVIYSALLLVFFSFYSQSQDYNVEWGDIESSKGAAYNILPIRGSEFYSLRQTGSRIAPSYRVVYHKDFKMVKNGRIITKVNGSSAILEGSQIIDGKFVVFLSDRVGTEKIFYMQEYSDDLEPKGIAIELAKFDMPKKRKNRGGFNVITSRNGEFFAVEYTIPGLKEESDKYGYKVYDNEINLVSEGDFDLPFDGNLSSIDQHYISNTGDYFLSVNEYEPSERKGIFRSYVNYKAMHIFHITPDGAEQYTMDMDDRRVESMTMSSDNDGVFSITGMYGEKGVGGVEGIFHIQLDFFKNKVIQEGFEAFTKDFITQDWSDRQKEKADKRAAKGKGEPQLYEYIMRDTEVLKDGSIIGSAEQYYVEVRTRTDANGRTTTTYVYHYNDIIAFKIGKDGDFDWIKKIDKYQASSNDGGPFSSYSRFVDGDKLVFIFNDNVDNYKENGEFGLQKDRLRGTLYRKKKNVVAIVSMDIETGEYDRNTLFSREEVDAIAIPKMFNVDYVNKEVLIYTWMRTKEKFGLMTLDN